MSDAFSPDVVNRAPLDQDWLRLVQLGSIGAIAMAFVALVGMPVGLDPRLIVDPYLSLGYLSMLWIPVAIGFTSASDVVLEGMATTKKGGRDLLTGAVAGLISGAGLSLLIVLLDNFDVRDPLVNWSPQLKALLTFDVGWRIRQAAAATRPEDERYSPVADRICEMGRMGLKTKAGWYLYEEGSRTPVPDPEIAAMIEASSAEQGIERREISDQEILERCLYPLVNLGAGMLEEGVALRPSDIDVIWMHGFGFPRYHGGPMFWADQIGLGEVHRVMQELHEKHGDLLRPTALLTKLAQEDLGFGDWSAE